jgi:hypothetical protein
MGEDESGYKLHGSLSLQGEVDRQNIDSVLLEDTEEFRFIDGIGTLSLTSVRSKLDLTTDEFYEETGLKKGVYESTRPESGLFVIRGIINAIAGANGHDDSQENAFSAYGHLRHIRPSSYRYSQVVPPGTVIDNETVEYRYEWGDPILTVPDLSTNPVMAHVEVHLGKYYEL